MTTPLSCCPYMDTWNCNTVFRRLIEFFTSVALVSSLFLHYPVAVRGNTFISGQNTQHHISRPQPSVYQDSTTFSTPFRENIRNLVMMKVHPEGSVILQGMLKTIYGPQEIPLIIQHPFDQSNCKGNQVKFSITVNGGTPPYTYQWERKQPADPGFVPYGEPFSGNTITHTITLNNIGVSGQNIHNARYRAVVTDSKGNTLVSNPAVLTVNSILGYTPPAKTRQTVCPGGAISFGLRTEGNEPQGFQWIVYDSPGVWLNAQNSATVSGVNTDRIEFASAALADAGRYRARVSFPKTPDGTFCQESYETERILSVLPGIIGRDQQIRYNTAPARLEQISPDFDPTMLLAYQWQSSADGTGNWSDIAGATSLAYNPPPLSESVFYRRQVSSDLCGTLFTSPVKVEVMAALVAGAVSGNQTICSGTAPAQFTSVEATGGTGNYTYQWQFSIDNLNWSAIDDANGLTHEHGALTSKTYFRVFVSDGTDTAVSNVIEVDITPDNTVSAASSTPTLCINTELTAITHTTTGATGIGAATGLPAGVSATWASNTITISGTPSVSGTFNYTIPLTGGCGTVSATGTINVTPDNTVSAPSSTPALCINTALTNITHTTTGATGIGAATGLPTGVSATWAGNTITISGTPTVSGTFNYSMPLTGGCGTVYATGTITVTPDNTVSAPSSTPTLCINTALTAITHTTTGATGIGAPSGLPSGVSAAWAGNTITISGTPTVSGTFNYSIPLTGGCGTVYATGTITVTPDNTVSAPSSTPTLCINTALTDITHTTTGATGIGAATGLPAGVSASWASNTITISGTPSVSGTFNYSIPLTGGCGTVYATGSITVTPENTVSAASSTPTLCINTALTDITHTTTGATGIGAPSGLPAGVSASWASNTITISGMPSVSGTFNYTIPLTGGCGTVSATGTITVTPDNTVSAASSTPTLCINTALTAITHTTTGATGIGAATGLPAGVSASWASNTITISGMPSVYGTFNYSIPLTGGCGTVSATGTITVNPAPTLSTVAQGAAVCAGSQAVINLTGLLPNTTFNLTYSIGGVLQPVVNGLTADGSGNASFNTTALAAAQNGASLQIESISITSASPVCTQTFSTSTNLTVHSAPQLQGCPATPINLNTIVGSCKATATYTITATGLPEPAISYVFSGATVASGSGTGSGAEFNTGTTTVTISATNDCGTATCVFNVVVTDNINPTITCPVNISESAAAGSCNLNIAVPDPGYGDNCGIASLTWTMTGATSASSPTSGINTIGNYTFNSGITTVTYTVTDLSNNTATCSFTVSITDTTPPVISGCPENITVYTGPGRMTCNQIATWTEPTATDNCTPQANITWTKTHNPNTLFPVGTTTVTYTARDAANNTSTCTFTVTVIDNTPPTFTVPLETTINRENNCTYIITPDKTGNIINPGDNCTPQANLLISYSDGAVIPGSCPGNFSFVRTWTVTDSNNNSTQKEQTIHVQDKTGPSLNRPANISIQCGTSTNPSVTGTATATDACGGPVTITYSDTQAGDACSYTITRTWVATDNCGNSTSGVQQIYVSDITPPTVQPIPITYITNRNLIPEPNSSVVIATDNCAINPVVFLDEIVYGLEQKAGYCPDSVRYIYRVSDGCGNYVDVDHLIVINDTSPCGRCLDGVPFRLVDFRSNPDTVYTFTVTRNSRCCDKTGNSLHCASFNIVLGSDAVGIEILVDGVIPQGQDWDQDCSPAEGSRGVYCLDPGKFHLFTYCKHGQGGELKQRTNTFTFRAVPGIVASKDVNARVECSTIIKAEATDIQDIQWTSIWPGTQGQYNHYLTFPNGPLEPVFTPDINAPAEIKYKICGYFPGNQNFCFSGSNTCDTISVYVKRPIQIELDLFSDLICEDAIPEFRPVITPAADYLLEWYSGSVPGGTLLHTGPAFTPLDEGSYTLKVTDLQEGVPCSTEFFPFDVEYDRTGPTFQIVPDTLYVECNSASSVQLIQDWLVSARATFTDQYGNIVTITPSNDFSFNNFNHRCDNIHTVHFTATDHCSNDSVRTSAIVVYDITKPIWLDTPGFYDRTLSCSDIDGLVNANLLEPLYYDDCDPVAALTLEKISGTFVPTNGCPNAGTYTNTWTVTDECGNISDVYTQVITIYDDTPPVFTFCPPAVTNQNDLNLCLINEYVLEPPIATDNCGTVTITWEKSGATTGTGSGTATGPFNVGVTTITYTATDACGLTATCAQLVTIVDAQDPEILHCPEDVTVTAPPPNCELEVITIEPLQYTDNCGTGIVSVTWEKTGATTGTGSGDVNGTTFQVGVTTVIYTVTDAAGNSATCSFTVTVDDEVPPVMIECDNDDITAYVAQDECEVEVSIITPTATDPCGQTFIITNDSPYKTSDTDASGFYPPGIYTISWAITDESGNTNTTCIQLVTVIDNHPPVITCPESLTRFADYGELYASGITPGEPVYTDNCGFPEDPLAWTMTPPADYTGEYNPADLSGTGIFTGTGIYYVGVTTIRYTVIDINGNTSQCSFTITVEAAPEIECADDIRVDNNAGLCTAKLDPGVPVLLAGGQPITWTWTIEYADGTTETIPAPFVGSIGNPGPPTIGEKDFQVGINRITWTASNSAGSDTCTQIVEVIDVEEPSFNPAPDPFEECVENLIMAVYNNADPINNIFYNPDYPDNKDYYLFRAGSTLLNLDMDNYHDNCCTLADSYEIRWRIDFDDGTTHPAGTTAYNKDDPTTYNTGQPSTFGADIPLWGDGIDFENRIHTIVYWIIDCNGNESEPIVRTITIKPRPQIKN